MPYRPTRKQQRRGPLRSQHSVTFAATTPATRVYANRTTRRYCTTPLRGAWQHPQYFHDGSAATFEAVVAHYDGVRPLHLTPQQKADLVEYLKSL